MWDLLYGLKWRWITRTRPEVAAWAKDRTPGCGPALTRTPFQLAPAHTWVSRQTSGDVTEWRCPRCGALAVEPRGDEDPSR